MSQMSEINNNIDSKKVDRVFEIFDRLRSLSIDDISVLSEFSPERIPLYDYTVISANLFLLPSKVEESLVKLHELGFISEVDVGTEESPRKVFALNQNGADAQILSKINS